MSRDKITSRLSFEILSVTFLICFSLSVFAQESNEIVNHIGKTAFQQKCVACHTIGEGDRVGPDLKDVSQRRSADWLVKWISAPDKMIADKDPIAIELLQKFNQIPMPNLAVSQDEAKDIISYIDQISISQNASPQKVQVSEVQNAPLSEWFSTTQFLAFAIFLVLSTIIVIAFWKTAKSTRNPVPVIDTKAAYAVRKKLFIGSLIIILGTLAVTLPFTPYKNDLRTPDQLVYVAAKQFNFIFSLDPINSDADMAQVKAMNTLEVPAGALVEFRVTSLDTTHGFGIYGPDGNVVTQTQAMPGYTNRLRIQFHKPGHYNVLCLEYCGVAHHLMRTSFKVK